MKKLSLLLIFNIIILTALVGCKKNDYYCGGEDVFITDNDVYVVGYICEGTSITDVPTLWINGEPQSVGQMGNFNRATSVFVDGDDIYVTVTEHEQGKAFLWKNGKVELLGTQEVNSVFVENGNVYVAGQNNGKPTLWTNGIPTYLSDSPGSAETVYVSEQDVYVTGYSGDYFAGTATVWKNGDEIQLSSKRSHANDICIVDNKIYIVGEENNNAVLWIDGKIQVLSSDKSVAYSIAVSNNNIYVSGIGGFDPVGRPVYGVWKNGIRQFISSEMRDEIKAVKINNDKVYLSGSSVNKIPLWIADIN